MRGGGAAALGHDRRTRVMPRRPRDSVQEVDERDILLEAYADSPQPAADESFGLDMTIPRMKPAMGVARPPHPPARVQVPEAVLPAPPDPAWSASGALPNQAFELRAAQSRQAFVIAIWTVMLLVTGVAAGAAVVLAVPDAAISKLFRPQPTAQPPATAQPAVPPPAVRYVAPRPVPSAVVTTGPLPVPVRALPAAPSTASPQAR